MHTAKSGRITKVSFRKGRKLLSRQLSLIEIKFAKEGFTGLYVQKCVWRCRFTHLKERREFIHWLAIKMTLKKLQYRRQSRDITMSLYCITEKTPDLYNTCSFCNMFFFPYQCIILSLQMCMAFAVKFVAFNSEKSDPPFEKVFKSHRINYPITLWNVKSAS